MAARSISMKLRHRPSKSRQASIRRLLTDNHCKACVVVLTRMDFAKILGKHNKVKIQYENLPPSVTPTRLKRNENGMVDLPRSAYSKHPAKDILSPKKKSINNISNKSSVNIKKLYKPSPQQKSPKIKKNVIVKECLKDVKNEAYYLSFKSKSTQSKEKEFKIKLLDLLPDLDMSILPSPNWTMHYLPDIDEPIVDKVYDKIAAELEDLMNRDVKKEKLSNAVDSHTDNVPSIMDILNDNRKEYKHSITTEVKSELESSDIEAMLMGSSSPVQQHRSATTSSDYKTSPVTLADLDEPGSPSILARKNEKKSSECKKLKIASNGIVTANEDAKDNLKSVTHLVFKEYKNNICSKTVTFPRNLKYKVEINGKLVELVAAPKSVASPKDIRNLLEIMDFTDLSADYLEIL